jgi:hypothetical protein
MPKKNEDDLPKLAVYEKVDPCNPRNFSDEKIIEMTKDWPLPLVMGCEQAEIQECRDRFERHWITGSDHGLSMFMNLRARWKQCRDLFESGTSLASLNRMFRFSKESIVRRSLRHHWKVPITSPTAIRTEYGKSCDQPISLITSQEEQELPASTQELMRERRLLNLAGAQWDAVPFRDQKEALRMRIHKLARRALSWYEEQTDEQIAQADTVKTLKELAAIAEKVAPVEVEQQPIRAGAMLHALVMQGGDVLPPRATVREIKAG